MMRESVYSYRLFMESIPTQIERVQLNTPFVFASDYDDGTNMLPIYLLTSSGAIRFDNAYGYIADIAPGTRVYVCQFRSPSEV
jgi:hypothetical protein